MTLLFRIQEFKEKLNILQRQEIPKTMARIE